MSETKTESKSGSPKKRRTTKTTSISGVQLSQTGSANTVSSISSTFSGSVSIQGNVAPESGSSSTSLNTTCTDTGKQSNLTGSSSRVRRRAGVDGEAQMQVVDVADPHREASKKPRNTTTESRPTRTPRVPVKLLDSVNPQRTRPPPAPGRESSAATLDTKTVTNPAEIPPPVNFKPKNTPVNNLTVKKPPPPTFKPGLKKVLGTKPLLSKLTPGTKSTQPTQKNTNPSAKATVLPPPPPVAKEPHDTGTSPVTCAVCPPEPRNTPHIATHKCVSCINLGEEGYLCEHAKTFHPKSHVISLLTPPMPHDIKSNSTLSSATKADKVSREVLAQRPENRNGPDREQVRTDQKTTDADTCVKPGKEELVSEESVQSTQHKGNAEKKISEQVQDVLSTIAPSDMITQQLEDLGLPRNPNFEDCTNFVIKKAWILSKCAGCQRFTHFTAQWTPEKACMSCASSSSSSSSSSSPTTLFKQCQPLPAIGPQHIERIKSNRAFHCLECGNLDRPLCIKLARVFWLLVNPIIRDLYPELRREQVCDKCVEKSNALKANLMASHSSLTPSSNSSQPTTQKPNSVLVSPPTQSSPQPQRTRGGAESPTNHEKKKNLFRTQDIPTVITDAISPIEEQDKTEVAQSNKKGRGGIALQSKEKLKEPLNSSEADSETEAIYQNRKHKRTKAVKDTSPSKKGNQQEPERDHKSQAAKKKEKDKVLTANELKDVIKCSVTLQVFSEHLVYENSDVKRRVRGKECQIDLKPSEKVSVVKRQIIRSLFATQPHELNEFLTLSVQYVHDSNKRTGSKMRDVIPGVTAAGVEEPTFGEAILEAIDHKTMRAFLSGTKRIPLVLDLLFMEPQPAYVVCSISTSILKSERGKFAMKLIKADMPTSKSQRKKKQREQEKEKEKEKEEEREQSENSDKEKCDEKKTTDGTPESPGPSEDAVMCALRRDGFVTLGSYIAEQEQETNRPGKLTCRFCGHVNDVAEGTTKCAKCRAMYGKDLICPICYDQMESQVIMGGCMHVQSCLDCHKQTYDKHARDLKSEMGDSEAAWNTKRHAEEFQFKCSTCKKAVYRVRIIHRDGKEEDKALDPVPWQKPSSGIQSRSAPVIPPSRADTFERLMDDADPSQFDFFL